ncbi:acyl-CoA thioesterase domain-containing protein [uncultured Caulobacter sp.]|jgi:acyl-coenzyme A thioesterase PaaI-like protein|uniref:acyl-CoA thioesterase domain-containing protein n=1 Tax=uncultured Caulobacter sp. TaxID=158749 RepID=UPI00262903A4|nr:acyl-CoA thioesterase domain-containing protein [uncultured Caulobacter sp.]
MDTSLSAQLESVLRKAAGEGTALASMTVDYAAETGDDDLSSKAWIERATRTLVFAQAELRRGDGALAASASAVFRRAGD